MNKLVFIVILSCFFPFSIHKSFSKTENTDYKELSFTIDKSNWENVKSEINESWISTDIRLEKNIPPQISPIKTCKAVTYPNTYTFSPPAESAWHGWYAANKNFDGYLRWAYNSWNENPLTDTRFISWGAGDMINKARHELNKL